MAAFFVRFWHLEGHANSSEQCPLLTQSGHRGQFRQTLAASIKVQV
jgi:hypothetical protein